MALKIRLHESTAPTSKVNVGDIFVYQFGYEANLVTFYKVTRIVDGDTVETVEMNKTTTNAAGYYDPRLGPAKSSCGNRAVGSPMKKHVYLSSYSGEPCLDITDYGFCGKWDGNPVDEYNYH